MYKKIFVLDPSHECLVVVKVTVEVVAVVVVVVVDGLMSVN